MKRNLSLAAIAALGAFMLLALSGVPLPHAAHAQDSPAVAVELSSTSVTEGTASTVTMSFFNLDEDSDRATTDYIFRADVVDANGCEDQAGGYGLGVDRKINLVDEDPEVRRGTISAGCPAGDYTVRASISDANGVELASATAGFSVAAPEPPASTDAALSSLALSGVTLDFDPATTTYTAEVGNDLAETTVTPTVNDDGATFVVRLEGTADDDSVIPLSVGENVITVVVTAEDGDTTRTYTVTLTRAAPTPEPEPAPTVAIALSPSDTMIEGEGTEIAVTLSFGNLTFDDDRATTDYTFRADVKDLEDGDADGCENQAGGYGLGVDRNMNLVDEDPEVRRGTISAGCPAGVYTLRASVSADSVELASATAAFYVLPPPTVVEVDDPDTALAAVSSRDITLHSSNASAAGVWSDGTTVWVSDPADDKLYAYTLANGTRDTSKEFSLHSDNGSPAAIWSNDTTIWVADTSDRKFYAYTLAGGGRDSGKDFNMATPASVLPRGIWSNGTTMWMADTQADKLYAYTLSGGPRDSGKDFNLHSDNENPWGIWSNDATIWVADLRRQGLRLHTAGRRPRRGQGLRPGRCQRRTERHLVERHDNLGG